MPMNIDCNQKNELSIQVLVIGTGPAGTSAARVAAAAGLSVVAIDKRELIGVPIQCAEYIPAPMGSYAMATESKIQSITDMVSEYNFNHVDTCISRGFMINRSQFDQALAARAQLAGASLWTSACLIALDQKNNVASLATKIGSCRIRYKLLIAADGPKSRVAKFLGLAALETIKSRQYTVALHSQSLKTTVWLSSRFPGGYAWLFPRGDVANLGIGFYSQQKDSLKKHLDALHKAQQSEGIVGEKILSRTGGSIPVAGIRDPLTCSNTVFVGDAAGLTHPISGSGIAAAVMSGEMAGQAATSYIKTENPAELMQYEHKVRDLYEASLQRAVEKRTQLRQYWQDHTNLSSAILKKSWISNPEYYR